MKFLVKTYRFIVDHLTKVIGLVGAALMSMLAYLDPVAVRAAAQTYLGDHEAEKMGGILFALVFVRGYFTGRKSREAAAQLAEAQELARIAMARAAITAPLPVARPVAPVTQP